MTNMYWTPGGGVLQHQGSGILPLKKSGIRDMTPEKIRDQGFEEKSGTLNMISPIFFSGSDFMNIGYIQGSIQIYMKKWPKILLASLALILIYI